MRKRFLTAICILGCSIGVLTGCGNKDLFDTQYTFNYAIIQLQNGDVVEGKVDSWTDYEGEQLQVRINGITYLTNSVNCTLIYNDDLDSK